VTISSETIVEGEGGIVVSALVVHGSLKKGSRGNGNLSIGIGTNTYINGAGLVVQKKGEKS